MALKSSGNLDTYLHAFRSSFTVISLMFFLVFLMNGWIPPVIISGVFLMFFMVKLAVKLRDLEIERYEEHRFYSKKFNRIEDIEGEIEKIKRALDTKADKPARTNVRTGSRPSEQYYAMIGRKEMQEHGAGAEDSSASQKSRTDTAADSGRASYQPVGGHEVGERSEYPTVSSCRADVPTVQSHA